MISRMAESSTPRRAAPLWVRIAGAVLVAFLLSTAVAGVFLQSQLRTIGEGAVEERIGRDIRLLAPLVRADLQRKEYAALGEIAAGAKASGVRVTVILPDGEVVAESDHPLPLPNHADRPEVRDAMRSQSGESRRHSATMEEDLLYVARRLDADDGSVVGILRIARPLAAVEEVDAELLQVLLFAGLLGLPVA